MRQIGNSTLTTSGFESVAEFTRLHHRGEWSDSEIKFLATGAVVVSRSLMDHGSLATKQRRMAILQGTESGKRRFLISVPREPDDSRPTKSFLSRILGLRKLFAGMVSHSIGPIQCSCAGDHVLLRCPPLPLPRVGGAGRSVSVMSTGSS